MSSTSADPSYGQTAVALGFVTEAQVQECVKIQASLRGMGLEEPLGEILAKKGFLTAQQHSAVLKRLGIQTSPIPGYTLQGKIGQGGMGTVYKAVQTSVNRTVAIKILTANATKDKTFVARFLQEAQSAAALNHRNLIAAIDVGVSNGIHYFIMEYVTGKSCRELLNAKGPFPEKDVRSLVRQMAEVLTHIHEHKMVHRDIKPENILLTADGVVKLCDLGLAKSTSQMEQSLTQEGLTVGTPYFMSPEQVRGDKDVDIRADLYSLGATLYFLATGRHPYEGKSAAETMSMHLNHPVPDPRKAAPGLGEDLALVIQKLMAKDRALRYQSPAELREDLDRLEAGTTPALARQHAARAHAMRTQRRVVKQESGPMWPIYAGAVALVVLGGASIWLFRPKPQVETKTVVVHVPTPAQAAPAGPKKPADDPRKLAEAASLLSSAEEAVKADRWRDGQAALQRLQLEFASLEFTKTNSARIGQLAGRCDAGQKAALSAREGRLSAARGAAKAGRWQEALDHFQQLPGSDPKEAEQCRRELAAEAQLKELLAARDAGRWLEVTGKSIALLQQHQQQRLSTVEAAQGEISTALLKARHEQEAAKALADIHAAAAGAKWSDVARQLADFEKHRESDTYRFKEGELRDLRARLLQANAAAAEDNALSAWTRSVETYTDLLADRKYDDAEETLRDFLQAYGMTKLGKSKEAEAQAKIADAGKRRQKEHDEEGSKLFQQYGREYKNLQFDLAAESWLKLMTEFADTPSVKSNLSRLKSNKAVLDQNVRPPESLVAELGFEDYPGLWGLRPPAQAINSPDEPYHGKRSARLSLPPDTFVRHPLNNLTPRAEFISFYARSRSGNRPAKFRVVLYDELPMGATAAFSLDLAAGPDWQKHTVRLADFKPSGTAALARKGLEPRQVTTILFGNPEDSAGATLELQVDLLKVESARASK
jgi:serine/threonine-protein kinase